MKNAHVSVIRKNIKHIYIRVYSDSRVVVSAPQYLSEQEIQDFIFSKRLWISDKITQQYKYQSQKITTDEIKPLSFQLWGETYPLRYQRGGRNSFDFIDNVGVVTLSDSTPLTKIRALINEYYRALLSDELNRQVTIYEPIIGVTVNEVRTKRMKTRWGTCNINAKRLWFNIFLAQFPRSCTEYVVVHEMTHLHERYHNHRFYHLVELAMPDWQQWHNFLKKSH